MKRLFILIGILWAALGLQAQEHETPNAKQARRMFMDTYNMIYGQKGSQLHYKVNIIGIYKTEGTIWTKGKKSKFIDERYIAWNDDVTYYRLERKKSRIAVYDAHSDERDKYATKFKFVPDNYTYSIKDSDEGYYITLNKHQQVRAGLCWIPEIAHLIRQHNDANVLVMPGRFIDNNMARKIMDEFFTATFEGGRHQKRVDKIAIK